MAARIKGVENGGGLLRRGMQAGARRLGLWARRGAALAATLSVAAGPAQASCTVDAMVVFDASASMTTQGLGGSTVQRIVEARSALAQALPQVDRARRIGLIVYGPDGDTACSGINLHFPPLPRAADRIIAVADDTRPAGLTPLTDAVVMAADVLEYRAQPGVIVLVTDGNESCDGTPCAMIDRLARDAVDLTVHVIGFKAVWDTFARSGEGLRGAGFSGEIVAGCLAHRTSGVFVSTDTVAELVQALEETLGCLVVGRVQ